MAYLSSTSARIAPENYSTRVKSITVRGVHHELHRDALYHGHPPAGRVRGDGMGRPSLRDEVDAGWLRLLLSGWRRLSTETGYACRERYREAYHCGLLRHDLFYGPDAPGRPGADGIHATYRTIP